MEGKGLYKQCKKYWEPGSHHFTNIWWDLLTTCKTFPVLKLSDISLKTKKRELLLNPTLPAGCVRSIVDLDVASCYLRGGDQCRMQHRRLTRVGVMSAAFVHSRASLFLSRGRRPSVPRLSAGGFTHGLGRAFLSLALPLFSESQQPEEHNSKRSQISTRS